jgi:hypothetical protein
VLADPHAGRRMSICPSVSPHAGPRDRAQNTRIWRHHIGALDCQPTAPIGGSGCVQDGRLVTGLQATGTDGRTEQELRRRLAHALFISAT